ncbi:SpaA isopeptide-forming pilin-related protein [Lacticaseibacillus jixianensis]|uniref:SpaA isopeptide-forming pilin-related protein n=1 Tax=Lacticaseibacillus jixianensis TaxID=2486012 RepID=A0ABW4B980_9LACO|nr:SpaA isopeptide-forming pilin-related protein [Lacticaseibacillus jixianensis]
MKTARRTSIFAALIVILVQLLVPASMALAASMTNVLATNWVTGWKLKAFNNSSWTDNGIWMKQIDGGKQIAFCVEHGIDLDMSGSDYTPSSYSNAKKERLAEIAYYGYYSQPSAKNYAVTQMMVWEELGDTLVSNPYSAYAAEKKAILAKVSAHDKKPSFNGQQITLAIGDSITLTDTNGRLAAFAQQTANTANLKITKSGNKLTLTATTQSKASGKVAYAIAKAADVGTSFVYTKGSQQKLVNFKLSSNGEFSLPIKVNLNGNLKAKKVDADTNKALPGAKLKFAYNGTTKEVTTGADGYAALNDLKAGTKVTVSEVTAPNGYVNKGELKEVTVEPNKTIEVVLGNKEQLGNVTLAKIGKEFGSDMFNAYYSLNGAVYGIYTSTGTRVGAITTDGNGKGTLQNLKLGSYYALEEKAPAGYVLNSAKLPFELKYAGQTVAVTTAHVNTIDQEQRGTATIIKEDAVTGKQPQGAASLNGAVYELHRAADDKLVKSVTIANNTASVSGLELDDYYWQEVKAPTGYVLDPQKHAFKLAYAGQNVTTATATTTVKEQVITGDLDLLKYGNYDWATQGKGTKPVMLKDTQFTVTSKITGKVVRTGSTDAQGYVKFTDLPYDTYTVTETKTPTGYNGIKPFTVTVDGTQKSQHYSIENKVIEEKLQVVKVDTETDKTVLRAGAIFRIKNLQTNKYEVQPTADKSGTTDKFATDNSGELITAEALGYGKYQLEEVQAPDGYVLAKEPAKFTIDGSHKDGIVVIKFADLSQKGVATLTKTGATTVAVEKVETKYGNQYKYRYDYTALAGAKFEFKATEDITTADGTVRAQKGDVVATGTTDAQGQIQTPELYLGKYTATEVSAPNGFILNTDPIAFELKYAGQEVTVTSTSLEAKNDFQQLDITLNKQEESITGWTNNLPEIKNVAGNGQVFGLFSMAATKIGDTEVPAQSLLATTTVKDGKAAFDAIQLPVGYYYVKELDAGNSHDLSTTMYGFHFNTTDNEKIKHIKINDGRQIENKLHENELTFKKINEVATLVSGKGYTYAMTGTAAGATFELLDVDKKVIQTITIGKDSTGSIKHLPVGTFYLRESKPSATNLVLSKETLKLVSTKDGVTVFDSKDEQIGETKADAKEPPIAFELTNDLIKGTGELTKTDVSTGKRLPNTGIRILDKNGKTVVSGRTNKNGVFSFSNLPAGKYSFQEYDAPKGYEISEALVPFEITKDGEIVKAVMKDKQTPKPGLPQTGNAKAGWLMVIGVVLLLGVLAAMVVIGGAKKKDGK